MAGLSVAEAAKLLGVGVSRVHQRIADGSLRAERIGSQWVVDELSALEVAERHWGGRPMSARSAWALVALAEHDEAAVAELAPAERARANARLAELFAVVPGPVASEDDVRAVAATLRARFRKRAARRLFRANGADLVDLAHDSRWMALGLSAPAAAIGAADTAEGYVHEAAAARLCADYLLAPAPRDGNVIMHVVADDQSLCGLAVAARGRPRRAPRPARGASCHRAVVRGGCGLPRRAAMTVLPAMPAAQTASWHGLLDLSERLDGGWTLIGGQLVHLHCAERGRFPIRATDDIDTVIDVRADPQMLHTFTAGADRPRIHLRRCLRGGPGASMAARAGLNRCPASRGNRRASEPAPRRDRKPNVADPGWHPGATA